MESHDRNEHRRFKTLVTGCALICIASLLLPIWSNSVLPFTDYPVHLALIQASGFSFNTPDILLQRFELQWFSPYLTSYILARYLSAVAPVETTGKLLLTIYLIATPLLFMRLMRMLGKPAYLAFPVFLMLYNFNLVWGFVPFLVAVPVLLETLNQAIQFSRRPSLRNGSASALLMTSLFFTHLFALMIALALYSTLLVAHRCTQRKISKLSILPVVPAIMLTIIWRMTLTLTESDAVFLDKGIRFAPLTLKFRFLPDYVISGDPEWLSRIIFACLVILILLRFLPDKIAGNISTTKYSHTKHMFTSENCIRTGFVAFIWLLYLICPYSWLTAVWLFNRIAFLAVAFVLLLLPVSSRLPASLYVITTTLLCLILMIDVNQRYHAFTMEAAPGLEVMEKTPPGKSLRYIALYAGSATSDHSPYTHFGQYHQIRFNGLVHNPFAVLTHIPIRYKLPYGGVETGFRSEPVSIQGQMHIDLAFDRHDCFLFRLSHQHSVDDIISLFRQNSPEVPDLTGHRNEWALFCKTAHIQ